MLIELADWQMEADVALTMKISSAQAKDHCMCGYCRNYYEAIDSAHPLLRRFFQQFGVDIEGPDELCPFEPTIYEATYIVQGKVLRKGTQQLYVDGIPLSICSWDESDLYTEHPSPYFTLTVGLIELPWVLSESMAEVISPANEDGFMERMQRKLLQRAQNDPITS